MSSGPEPRRWQVVYVEDDPTMLRQVAEYLEGETFPFGTVKVTTTSNFTEAIELLKERKVDVLILDVYRGDTTQADRAGLEVLQQWRTVGFAPVILHTALAEEVSDHEGVFIRLVPKEAGNLERLASELGEIFATKIPQIHRMIIEHIDASLRTYMWGFVVDRWPEMKELATRGDFVRLLLQRLGFVLSRAVAPLIDQLYPEAIAADPAPDKVHPVEYYVKPPIGVDPRLGDLRWLSRGGARVLHAVIWPSCDLVIRDGAQKVEKALTARVHPLSNFPEHKKWSEQSPPSRSSDKALRALMSNNRQGQQPERYFFLPPAWGMDASVVDLADLEHVALSELNAASCEATIASPFAESMAAQFVRYLARLGTPDLDLDIAMSAVGRSTPTPAAASATSRSRSERSPRDEGEAQVAGTSISESSDRSVPSHSTSALQPEETPRNGGAVDS